MIAAFGCATHRKNASQEQAWSIICEWKSHCSNGDGDGDGTWDFGTIETISESPVGGIGRMLDHKAAPMYSM